METQRRTLGRPFITRFIAGVAIGLGTTGALFAVASAAASGLSVNFASVESDSHRRNAEFDAAHTATALPQAHRARSTRLARGLQ
jgi:hypothetical protein